MKKIYRISGVDCANCAAEIERNVSRIDGVQSASYSFLTGRLVLTFEGDEAAVFDAVCKAARRVEPDCEVR